MVFNYPSTDSNGGFSTLTCASINSDGTGTIAIGFARRNTGVDWTPPTGYTEDQDGQASEAAHKLLASGGASGTYNPTSTGDAAAGGAWLGILEQAGGGGGGPTVRPLAALGVGN